MKIFFVVINIILGLAISFWGGVNNLLYLATMATQDPGNQYYYGVSLSQGFAEAIFWTIVGVFSIVSALAFRKDKHWATLTLPLPPLVLLLNIVYMLFSSTKSELGLAGGILTMVALVLLLFLISEIFYLSFRKKTQIV